MRADRARLGRDGGRIAGAAYAAGALVLMHVLLVLATVLKFSEENRVMHLGSPRTRALFAPQAAVRHIGVIVMEIVMVVLSTALALLFVDR